jgi:hypothetical protein
LRSHLHSLHTGFGKRSKSCLYRSDFTNDVGKLHIKVFHFKHTSKQSKLKEVKLKHFCSLKLELPILLLEF